jgi:hypothetical protein
VDFGILRGREGPSTAGHRGKRASQNGCNRRQIGRPTGGQIDREEVVRGLLGNLAVNG